MSVSLSLSLGLGAVSVLSEVQSLSSLARLLFLRVFTLFN